VSRVGIVLRQGAISIALDHDDTMLLAQLTDYLRTDMALVVSNYDVDANSDIYDGQCPRNSICGTYTTTLRSFQWTSGDAIDENEATIIGDVAESLEYCADPFCTACHEAWYLSDPSEIHYQCMDYRRFKYSNLCNNWRRKENLCGSEDICFRSFPEADAQKWKSDEAACRPLPSSLMEGEFKYAKRTCRETRGLCGLGCGEAETCYNSFPIDDPLKFKSPHSICRCKNDTAN